VASVADKSTDRPISSSDELVAIFLQAAKPVDAWRVGTEHEKIGVVAATGLPAPWEGPQGIQRLLERLERDFGWAPLDEKGVVVGLARGDERVSLEPGGQFEHSGAPHAVGASLENSAARGEGGAQDDNEAPNRGAVHVFRRTGTAWQQAAYD